MQTIDPINADRTDDPSGDGVPSSEGPGGGSTSGGGGGTNPPSAPGAPVRRRRGRRVLRALGPALLALVVVLAGAVYVSYRSTEGDIEGHRERIDELAVAAGAPVVDVDGIADLPAPVRRFVAYTFPSGFDDLPTVTEFTMEGDFRRPLTEGFNPTTAEQIAATGVPAFVFSATTPVLPGVWARAYDAFGEGEMEMKAKVLSTLTVVDERETPELNRTSLQRWLLESPMYPAALLPGGAVRWEPIDGDRARAIVSADGLEATLVATFRADGSLERFDAEEDGDLTTPYHGSGEHTTRGDYRLVDGMMLPHEFAIARAAGGELYPFWTGTVTSIEHR